MSITTSSAPLFSSEGALSQRRSTVDTVLLKGKAVGGGIREDVARRAATLPFDPTLAIVLVGDDPASTYYSAS
ncbi:MAG: hypothetical protein KAW67_02750, partial [Candidatus Eisenbacteria sp.]|nr:hypothetical protein [Candidatus Eisenbacteria bacterium]